MTACGLQEALAREIEEITSNMLFKTPKGGMGKLKAYSQELPKPMQELGQAEEDNEPCPYCIVQLENGRMAVGAQEIKTLLIITVFDDNPDCQGHKTLFGIMDKIADRFGGNPMLGDCYRMYQEGGITWVLDDEDNYPFYAGALEMSWLTAATHKEEDIYA